MVYGKKLWNYCAPIHTQLGPLVTASVTFYFATPTFSKGGGGDNGKWAGAGGGRAVGG